jgi:hypothetical protein
MKDHRPPAEVIKAQRMMVIIFGFATLMPTLWMVLMAWNGITLGRGILAGGVDFSTVLIYWGLSAPLVWLVANGIALKKINDGDGETAKFYPLVPAFWAIIWFASQVSG